MRIKFDFKGQFILFSIVQAPRFGGQVAKIFFHEDHRRLELHVDRFLTVIRQLVVVARLAGRKRRAARTEGFHPPYT
jgi:hypothetical protein